MVVNYDINSVNSLNMVKDSTPYIDDNLLLIEVVKSIN